MVLRCSLLGHDYGESEVEREREERGSEVVLTVQEYEECVRCGDRNVISENTEVTSLSAETDGDSLPNESDPEPDTTDTADADTPDISAAEPTPEAAGEADTDAGADGDADDADDAEFIDADDGDDDAEFIDDDVDESTPATGDTKSVESTGDLDVPTDDTGEPVTDDGEILDDDETGRDRDREHGEWPESEDVGPPVGAKNDPAKWPDDDEPASDEADTADDTPLTADPEQDDAEVTDDAVVLEDNIGSDETGESTAAADARSVTTQPPNPADGRDERRDEATAESAASQTDSGTGIKRASTAPSPGESGGTPSEDVPSEFYCPQCEFVAAGNRGSLRAGDICPECRKGYLGERERR
ncbi:hypothetical protein GS429_04545 [Natronorubrum sp. JWXQ-INN-674]|uniref:Uncharacterized protein n=1 Tax=Natronorubrum halalkaliphilum TaxID=2691917 RepID=A0A6B0VJB4_9EURY|nr:hypothetical protein [Natronorubrum halalkaliphilum]MXV61343.1 hypothetical protein [Natronorubrum halalkaliphilum]